MAWLVADEMVQIRGGRGFETAESLRTRGERAIPAEQILRDLRIGRIFEGSTEIMKLLIAREAVDEHLRVAGELIDPDVQSSQKVKSAARAASFYGQWLPHLAVGPGQRPGSYADFGNVLAPHLRFVERSSRRLARSTFYGMSRWHGRLERKQGFLGRMVDIGAELYAMSAACVRAKMLVDDGAVEDEEAQELADLFCRSARRRVERHFHDLWHNDDAQNYEAALRILEGHYLWAEEGVLDPSLLAPPVDTRVAAEAER